MALVRQMSLISFSLFYSSKAAHKLGEKIVTK